MSEKFRLDRKTSFQNTFYTKCINVIIDSIGPSIILRSIYDLWPTYSFLPLLHDWAFGNGCIDHFTDLLNDLHNRYYKYWQGKKFKFLCKLIGCEAQEGAEWTINAFVVVYWLFFKIIFSQILSGTLYQSVKLFRPRSGQMFSLSWSRSKLFAEVISRWQKSPLVVYLFSLHLWTDLLSI